jgi:hypothetical protein
MSDAIMQCWHPSSLKYILEFFFWKNWSQHFRLVKVPRFSWAHCVRNNFFLTSRHRANETTELYELLVRHLVVVQLLHLMRRLLSPVHRPNCFLAATFQIDVNATWLNKIVFLSTLTRLDVWLSTRVVWRRDSSHCVGCRWTSSLRAWMLTPFQAVVTIGLRIGLGTLWTRLMAGLHRRSHAVHCNYSTSPLHWKRCCANSVFKQ